MTTYVLSLTGDEEKAANATHWATFRKARMLSVSRGPREAAPADAVAADSIVITGHGPLDELSVTRHPQALAALLVRTLDIQDGAGVVLADFDSDEFAADVVAQIAALGRDVKCPGRASKFAFGAGVRARVSRP